MLGGLIVKKTIYNNDGKDNNNNNNSSLSTPFSYVAELVGPPLDFV